VHYVFNPGCYFRMINAKYNIHIIINTECSLCIATDILYNNYKYNTECFMHQTWSDSQERRCMCSINFIQNYITGSQGDRMLYTLNQGR
jgi:hypothetical protein